MLSPPSSAFTFTSFSRWKSREKLQRALALPTQRRDLLQELFADIALEVDDRAKEILFSSENLRSASEEKIKGPICYFDVLADHFIQVADSGKPILSLIVQLWSQQSFACHIFSLLFHKWLFEVELDKSESLLRYSSALVQGATDVFWIDVHSNTKCFQSLFRYLFEEVSLVPERLKKIPFQAQRNLFLLLSRFIFFYNLVDKLEMFLSQFPDFPNAVFIGGPADFFVTEVADQLQKLKVEPVLLHYLSQVKVLRGLELRMTTSTRLRTCLYSFTSPGAPMYPTRAVRHAAWDALNFLFPVGRYPRQLISIFFRLLYPWYWPSSFWNFIKSCVVALFYSVLRLIFSRRDKSKEKQF
nr:K-stimulated pyrophosphate-energized sodium pump protein [Ipomoea batatas]